MIVLFAPFARRKKQLLPLLPVVLRPPSARRSPPPHPHIDIIIIAAAAAATRVVIEHTVKYRDNPDSRSLLEYTELYWICCPHSGRDSSEQYLKTFFSGSPFCARGVFFRVFVRVFFWTSLSSVQSYTDRIV